MLSFLGERRDLPPWRRVRARSTFWTKESRVLRSGLVDLGAWDGRAVLTPSDPIEQPVALLVRHRGGRALG